jgi:unsaturated rhamnogalacturonyl hydrolase
MYTDIQSTFLIEKVTLALLAMQRHSWEQGVTAQAFLELGDADLVVLLAKDALVRQTDEGRLAVVGSDEGVSDPAANGEAVLYAGKATGDPAFRAAAERELDYLLHKAPRTPGGVIYHFKNMPQVWVDCLYMQPPFLAVIGQPEEALRQIEGVRILLWNPKKKLFSHIWDEGKQAFQRRDFWGVGNGWAAAGMARVLGALPERMAAEKQRLIVYIREVLDGCLAYQCPDGLFHNVVDQPGTFIETNLAQMLAYTIYTGMRIGWLEESYRPAADLMRAAAHQKVDRFGLVQGVCGAPDFDHAGTAPEGQAFFLLMEAAFKAFEQ